jgi:hypothetical protein
MSDHKALARDFLAVIGVALIYVTPAFAAPPQIEDYCWAKAAQIWFNGRGDREHFMANCIADLTLTPRTKGSRYKKPR